MAGMELSGVFEPFQLQGAQQRPHFSAAGAAGHLWIRATDACGNSTIQQLDFNNQCGTPTPTASVTGTLSPSRTRTESVTVSSSDTPSVTSSGTPTQTVSPTPTGSRTLSPSTS